MSIFRNYAKKSLKKNRTRTMVTVIGIVLSMAMLTAVTTIITSVQNYGVAYEMKETGGWHVNVSCISKEDLAAKKSDTKVLKSCELAYLGYAVLPGGENSYKPYLCLQAMNEAFSEVMPINLTEGRMPENGQELLIPEHVRTNGGVEITLGERLELEVGKRACENGEIRWQNRPLYISEEKPDGTFDTLEHLSDTGKQTYTVVGFYVRPVFEGYTAPGYTALTVDEGKAKLNMPTDVWFVLKHPKDAIDFYSTIVDMKKYDTECNNALLRFYGFSVREDFNSVLYGMGSILIFIIVLGSVALIYNAFAISISERTKEFGLLLSIGATKKQMKQTIRYEALLLCLIGIPAGTLAGIAGIGITLSFFKNALAYLIGNKEGVELKLAVTPVAILISAVIGIMTVLLSAYLPMRRALKGSAIDAVRLQKDIQLTKRKLKIPGWIQKCFGVNGMLAWKNFKRNRTKYRATVVSLAMSILLFVSAGAFSEYLFGSFSRAVKISDYDIAVGIYSSSYEKSIAVNEQIEKQSVAEQIYHYQNIYYGNQMSANGQSLTEKAGAYYDGQDYFDVCVNFIPDETFRTVLEAYGLQPETYFDQTQPRALVLNTIWDTSVPVTEIQKESGEVPQLPVLKPGTGSLTMTQGENELLLELGDIVESMPAQKIRLARDYSTWSGGDYGIALLYPLSNASAVLDRKILAEAPTAVLCDMFYFTAQDHRTATESIRELMKEEGSFYVDDRAEQEEQLRAVYMMIQVFCFGFITLISLIAAANIFNTISTNMNQRRREFAMLKSMGMTRRDFARMLNFECLKYGSKGIGYGLFLSLLSTLPMYYFSHEKSMDGYYIPWRYVVIAAFCVFAVVYVAMLYGKSQLKKVDMIESLKGD